MAFASSKAVGKKDPSGRNDSKQLGVINGNSNGSLKYQPPSASKSKHGGSSRAGGASADYTAKKGSNGQPNRSMLPNGGTIAPLGPNSKVGRSDLMGSNAGGASDTKRAANLRSALNASNSQSSFTIDWSSEEQKVLEESLNRIPGEKHSLERYIRIAALLPEKGVRDVALRIRWMSKKENGKRRKPVEDSAAIKKNGNRREKGAEKPSIFSMHSPLGMPYGMGMNHGIDMDGRNSGGANVGGVTGKLLEQNVAVINTIRHNLSGGKIHENTELIMRFRDNVTSILNSFTVMPGVMSHMPPLPVGCPCKVLRGGWVLFGS